MKWFKFYGQDYISDPKILALSASERSCWITLLSYGSINDDGFIKFLDEEQLMVQSGISPMHEEWEMTSGILEKLKKLEMITLDNGLITILNWGKRQETSLTAYQRVKRYREKKRNDNNDNEMITPMITIEENRIEEKRREENKKVIASDEISSPIKKKKGKPKTLTDWANFHRARQGKDPISKMSVAQKKNFNELLKIEPDIQLYRRLAKERGFDYFEMPEDANAQLRRQMMWAKNKLKSKTQDFYKWIFSGDSEWAVKINYDPQACISAMMIRAFQNKDNVKKESGILSVDDD